MASHWYEPVVARLEDRQPACGTTTVVAVDGPSGSGKTSFVAGLADVTGADVLHLEDLYPGWHGLAATPDVVARVLASVAVGDTGTARRWDWAAGAPGSLLHVPPTRLLLLDGVGSGASVVRPFLSLLIWLEAPADVRKERALTRDGDTFAPFWDVWAEQEARHFAAEGTRGRADLVVRT
ncbi:4-amino-4-deoxy-L-arabinose transferase [Aeromicrobium sp. CFBP 8757]|uniref:4-amino-4-deoxy-L-arabinose transferase n=1 Tax=Aeromicrobium sp. CFBP 8757 TaxID=2775288 RepID=UPI001781D2BB|nr:4-amino-4-deoxy-L-arabinose transferase [Aeromicrobium sp. CFBP 8757]MBD8607664.1 4-amino-4-deoxy-L-arabinose transferase [Aeromicrobium sp. CFBP 8757]